MSETSHEATNEDTAVIDEDYEATAAVRYAATPSSTAPRSASMWCMAKI